MSAANLDTEISVLKAMLRELGQLQAADDPEAEAVEADIHRRWNDVYVPTVNELVERIESLNDLAEEYGIVELE